MISGVVARHTLGILRPTITENAHGNEVRTYPALEDAIPSHGWALDAGATSEDRTDREGIVYAWTARGPFGADVKDDDKVVVFGEAFDIDGGVLRQPGPSPITSHTILALRRVDG